MPLSDQDNPFGHLTTGISDAEIDVNGVFVSPFE
jgi:hypothetical protein